MSDATDNPFADVLEANARATEDYQVAAPSGVARLGLAVITCIDTRIDPLSIFGLEPGLAKFFRNAGGRVTDDAIRSMAAATAALGVRRIAVVQHTLCKMASVSQDEVSSAVAEAAGIDVAVAAKLDYWTIADQKATLGADIERLRQSPVIPSETQLAGFILDLDTGRLRQVV